MKPSGIEVLKKLKEIKGYKIPTLVILEDNKFQNDKMSTQNMQSDRPLLIGVIFLVVI